jgi:sigma-B regulation protein RsbU (phosphoserine phosphatase)
MGVADRDGEMVAYVRVGEGKDEALIVWPLDREFLSGLVPGLGEVSIVSFDQQAGGEKKTRPRMRLAKKTNQASLVRLPDALNSFDFEVIWGSPIRVAGWGSSASEMSALFTVRSRVSSVLKVLFSQKTDWDNSWALILIGTIGVLFLVVELVALIIGVSLSRSITSAVHNLYEGTERVMEGDFSHRIRLKGRDQLAALGDSFNRMTENVERLLRVAKEKERYEAELSIAREIQAQLYPRRVPESSVFAVTALYKPARSVSGDYYDYRRVSETKIAIAMGDVAGKGSRRRC